MHALIQTNVDHNTRKKWNLHATMCVSAMMVVVATNIIPEKTTHAEFVYSHVIINIATSDMHAESRCTQEVPSQPNKWCNSDCMITSLELTVIASVNKYACMNM